MSKKDQNNNDDDEIDVTADLAIDDDVIELIEEEEEVVEEILPTKRKKNYLNNADMLLEVKKSLAQNKMTDKLAHMMILLTDRYGNQPKYSGYSYITDMKSYATYMVCRTWNRFNPERGVNAFAFFTQCIKHSFFQYLNKEKHQRNIRDKLLITSGLNPSNTYIVDYESDRGDYNNDDISDSYFIEPSDCVDSKSDSSSIFGNYESNNSPSDEEPNVDEFEDLSEPPQ